MVMELGRLVFDVKLDEIGDKKVLNNRLAIQVSKGKTTFIDIVAWNGTAELISKYFKKGFEILIQGHLINNKKKKNDVEYESVAILVDKVIFTNGNHKNIENVPDFLE